MNNNKVIKKVTVVGAGFVQLLRKSGNTLKEIIKTLDI